MAHGPGGPIVTLVAAQNQATVVTGTSATTLANFAGAATGHVDNPPAVIYVKELGFVTNTTASGTADTITTSGTTVPIGDYLVIYGACDNTGSGGAATTISVADNSAQSGTANSYTLQTPQAIADPGAASAGQQGFFVVCPVTRSIPSGTVITVTYGNATAAKAINVQQFTPSISGTISILGSSYTRDDNETGQVVSLSATPTMAGQVVCTLVAVEGGTADTYTEDADTTNGSWVTLTRRGSGTTTSGSTLNSAYKYVTASGAQSYGTATSLGTGRDHCGAILVLNPPSITGTVAVTLQNVTGSASGTVDSTVTGTSAQTLANFTSAATGTNTPPGSSGTVAVTLANFTSAATGTETISGTVARTLANFTSSASGTLTPPAAVGLFPTTVSANGRYLKDQNGDPWMAHGDTGWELVTNVSLEDAAVYLDDRASRGVNAVIIETPIKDPDNVGTNFYGNLAFSGTAFQSSLNEAHWQHTDAVIQHAGALGITVYFWVAYLGFNHGVEGWWSEIAAANNTQIQAYGTALGNRYKDYDNIVWVVAGDYIPTATEIDRYDHLMQGIQGTGDTHLATAHLQRRHDGAESFNSFSWFTLNSTYTVDPDTIANTVTAYNRTTVRPTFLVEARYENFNPPGPTYAQIRREQWQQFLAGGLGGHFFGNENVWSFNTDNPAATDDTNWKAYLADPGLGYTQKIWQLLDQHFTGADWAALVPDLTDTFLTSGESSGTTQAAASFSTHIGFVYIATTGSITVDLTEISGHSTALCRWYDPTDGGMSNIGTFSTSAPQTFTHPGTNTAGDNDWVLVVTGTQDATGTVAVTLANFTGAATGTETITGTVARTLANFTSSASGTETITGTSAVTLANFTSTATGTESYTGTSATTLANFTGAATGTETFTGTVAVTLANFTGSASGTVANPVTGTVAVTLANFTSSASGTETFTGTAAVTLQNFTSSASGLADVVGTSAVTLANFVSAVVATETFTGTSATTLQNFTAAASGLADITGTVAVTLAALTSSASGSVTNPGSNGASVLQNFTGAATGTVVFTGTSAVTLQNFTSAAVATETITGTSATTLANFTGAATGAQTSTGSSATTLQNFTSSATGTQTITGSAAVTLANFTSTATGTGNDSLVGTVAVTLANFAVSAAGTETFTGTVARTLANFICSATGTSLSAGGGAAITLQPFDGEAEGTVTNPPGGLGDQLPFDDNVTVIIGGRARASALIASVRSTQTPEAEEVTVTIVDRPAIRGTTFDELTVLIP